MHRSPKKQTQLSLDYIHTLVHAWAAWSTCMFGPVGSTVISSEMDLWSECGLFSFPRPLIKIEISRVWPGVSVVTNRMRDACNEKSRIFAQPIKTSRVSYWSGKLASSSMLFNVGLDVSVRCSSSSPHFSTQSRLKMGAHWCDCGGPWKDTEIFSADVTTSLNRSVALELDYFFWCGSLGVIAYLQTETDHTQGLCIDNHQLCFIESSHVNIERSNISQKNSVF